MAKATTETQEPLAEGPAPVSSSVVTETVPPPPVLRLVANRPSHVYFRNVQRILRSLGKMRSV
jgi:hypothetical protein